MFSDAKAMGKRGPQAKGEYGRKIGRTAVLSTRLQPDTRARLAGAARARGRSLSQELEHRLRRTFLDDDKVVEFFGSQSTAAILKMLGAVIQVAGTNWLVKGPEGWGPDVKKDPDEWLRDPALFDQVRTAIVHTLMWFKPSGGRDDRIFFYNSTAEQIIKEIQSADPSLPIAKRSTRQHAMALLKDGLGDLARRQHPYDESREKAPRPRSDVPKRATKKRDEKAR
jgi:hypothetical protein